MDRFLSEFPVVVEAAAEVCPSDPVAFARERLGFEPDEVQARVLRSTAKLGILNCTRQWGKSTVIAAKAVHRAYSYPDALVLAASPSGRQSGEFILKASEMVKQLGIKPRGDGTNKCSLLLPNGARIVGLPGVEDTGRGFSRVSLLLVDEAARVDDRIFEMLFPMLATGNGDLWVMSTPNGKSGFFYDAWTRGGPDWQRETVTALDCPRIPREFLEKQRGLMGKVFDREYMCEFQDHDLAVFAHELVERAYTKNVSPLRIDSRRGDLEGRIRSQACLF